MRTQAADEEKGKGAFNGLIAGQVMGPTFDSWRFGGRDLQTPCQCLIELGPFLNRWITQGLLLPIRIIEIME